MPETKEYKKLSKEESQKFAIWKAELLKEGKPEILMSTRKENFEKSAHMIQALSDFGKFVDDSKPFRIIIDYDPEQARVVFRRIKGSFSELSHPEKEEGTG